MEGGRVRFLGSGDAFGSGGRLQTCIALEFPSARLLLDCGASSLIAIKREGMDPAAIEAILATHLHGDHFGGIPFFVLDAQFSRRAAPLTIAGPPGIEARVRQSMETLFPGSSRTRQRFPIRFIELAEGEGAAVGAASVTAFAVVHASGAPAYALRVACDGRAVAYSGDTEWTPALLHAAAGADLFICEAYYYEKRVPFHLDYQTLRAHRDELACRRLILTHMSQDMLDHRHMIDILCAEDGTTVPL
jgi:ribonuclease BN (tRNA processing enzyme)